CSGLLDFEGKCAFLQNGGCKGELPLPSKEGAQDAKHPSKGTIGFPSEKKLRSNFFVPGRRELII
ncbi:hypothetical protein, partial [Lutispora sp.]|uniref:hypothetical protein n=1 Tax=Lutispora sp. TaxID=2828727 RepID=UPI003569E3C7